MAFLPPSETLDEP